MNVTPVHVLSGFLGAGKTTLLNRALSDIPPGVRPAIVVNDFGEVALDGALVERAGYAMAELASGCVCCTLSGPLEQSLAALIDEQRPDTVLMEATGLAEPAAFPALFDSGALRGRVSLGNVVCVVDASTFCRYEHHLVALQRQVLQANTIILNKADLAGAEELAAARRRIEVLCQPGALIVEADHCQVEPSVVYQPRPIYFEGAPHLHGHDHEYHSHTLQTEQVLPLAPLLRLLDSLKGRVERAKGVVATDEGPRLIQLTLAGTDVAEWPEPVAESRLVFVARAIEELGLEAQLASLLA